MGVTLRLLALRSAMASWSLRRRSRGRRVRTQRDFRQAEQASRDRYRDLENVAARRAALGIQRRKLRESIRHCYRWITGRKPAEH